jgi:glycosyltransferase involved in cell wall biosynthesis
VVSRLVPRKGIADVLHALARLPAAELVVAGGPARDQLGQDPEARRLLELAERLGVADRFELAGRVDRDQLPALLRSADVAVCAPWYEPFGMAAVEAMACGLPVVASAVGGQIDTVLDGVTGLHVPPREPATLAAGVAAILADPARAAAFGQAGARRARRRYGWDRVAASTLDAYARMTGAARAPVRRPSRARRERTWSGLGRPDQGAT